jgi:hypothetical protein
MKKKEPEAFFRDGVMKVTFSKISEPRTKKIAVKTK